LSRLRIFRSITSQAINTEEPPGTERRFGDRRWPRSFLLGDGRDGDLDIVFVGKRR
jgi:hypothetical protein